MNKLKQNAFWVVTGAAGGVVLIFFAVMVAPLTLKKGTLQHDVKQRVGKLGRITTIYSNQDIASFEENKAKTVEQYAKIGQFYSNSNDHLERWFPKLNVAPNQDPPRDGFISEVRREREEIEKSLKEKGVKIGIGTGEEGADLKKHTFGFNWEEPDPADFNKLPPGDEKRVLKDIQKRFWARQRVANAILAILTDSGKVNRVHDFRFFRKLHPSFTQAPWEAYPGAHDVVHYAGVGAQLNMAPPNFQEYELPNKLGKTLTFGFALELPYSQVPRVISEMLNPAVEKSASARLLVNVVGTHVTIREQNQPEIRKTVPKNNPQEKEKALREAQEGIKPIDVLLTVTCQIIDFEPSELKKFDAVADAKPENK